MPVHDWRRVDTGTFHAFHMAWLTHLSETLNARVLPPGYYAMPEQHAGRMIADVLTLQAPSAIADPAPQGGVAIADAPPRVRWRLSPSSTARGARRTVVIRHVSGHRVVALVEIVSPAKKDRKSHVEEFADKAENAMACGINLLLVDVFPPGSFDPTGMHGAIWERFDDEPYLLPRDEPLTLASYVAEPRPEAYLEHLSFGSLLPEMPLFLNPDRYVQAPLEQSYMAAFRGMPAIWRDTLES